jgi:hypothetical protein
MVLMFQVFVAVLSAAAAIEVAALLKHAYRRWRVASEIKDPTLAVDSPVIVTPETGSGSKPPTR